MKATNYMTNTAAAAAKYHTYIGVLADMNSQLISRALWLVKHPFEQSMD